MPLYEYACGDCGAFTATRPLSEYLAPQPCPGCGTAAPRALITAPAFSAVPGNVRKAHAINEQAAHAPRTSAEPAAARHKPGCGCCGVGRATAVKGRNGSTAFPAKRPWMISH